ncbi:MAG TPA: hypothetical protein VFX92_06860, partial [Candidatus Krumholzibacteria bacterium]|nr:hypothetical protein [Candidatus Krumholzibacteria bacterium]
SQLQVVPHPDAETVEERDCAFEPIESDVRDFTLSVPPYTCPCSGVHRFDGTPKSFGCGGPVAVESTTWGRIKALYRE